jgi:outer membrane protein assembly factor BamB
VFLTSSQDEGRKRSLYCFDRTDGRELWVRTVDFSQVTPTHNTNPRCPTTPAADGKRVVVWYGSAGLHCYDFDGTTLWSRDLGEFKHMWGDGSSPVIYKDRVLLSCGPGQKIFVTALDLATGKTLWQTDEPISGDGEHNEDRKYMGSWSTPVVARVDGQDQLICALPTRVNGYDIQSGEIVWYCEGLRGKKGDLSYSSPIVAGDVCVVIGGFNGPAIGFKLGGKGNITETNRLWRAEPNPQSIGSGVYVGKHIYTADAGPGTIRCIEPQTGKAAWQSRGEGGNHWGSVVLAGGNLYVTNQRGTTTVFKPNPNEFEQVASNPLNEASNSTPAISNGELFLRTFEHLYCIAN